MCEVTESIYAAIIIIAAKSSFLRLNVKQLQ